MEKQHQRECEREQHEFRMLQMRLMMTQRQQPVSLMQSLPQSLPQSSLDGFGLMDELTGNTVPSESSSSLSTPFPI
jgi:hypothetical protein